MTAYYNEIDAHAAAWLRNLIAAGHIAPGDVDERDIQDVHPSDLKPYTQCHFFAGIGVWSYALRRAGWPDDRPVWTGSCPCQPFSTAGKGLAFDDERHLWPAWHHLIKERRPPTVLGEQVAGKDADAWVDLVHDDMEAMAYAFGAVPFPAAGVGAPHIRDRLYWVAHATGARPQGRESVGRTRSRWQGSAAERSCTARGLADALSAGRAERRSISGDRSASRLHGVGGLADPKRDRICARGCGCPRCAAGALQGHATQRKRIRPHAGPVDDALSAAPGPANGLWRDADWLLCRDGKWRPVEPGAFPLAHGAPARVGRLRAYGNAINAEAALAFIEAVIAFAPTLDIHRTSAHGTNADDDDSRCPPAQRLTIDA
ncbi:DNA cytosine methyltransferase [Ralstonia mannitolilytica]|uniref:DNA cytosine methyltransferase n=1 Tax=Ralstonia mannitolilytica TaxID=105219 RepID=UPI000CEEC594|nr:DNA cytosine methyltransferase [Ralstonia mannitolilytica]MBU9579016.1 DNA cytosine methyltransferase [Ralstonia mannitolilytica]